MSFFPPLPEPEPRHEPPRQYPVFPGQPPENWLPGLVPWCVVLARTDDTVVALTQAAAYPQGVALTVTMLQRPGTEARGHPHWQMEGTATMLRVGALFADGRRALVDDTFVPPGVEVDGSTAHLTPQEGNGGGLTSRQSYWLWPLPPAGPLGVYCEWPGRGIPETKVELDAGDLVAAAARAVELWPMPEVTGDYGWTWPSHGG